MFHKLFDGHPELCVYPVDISLLYAYIPCFTSKKDFSENDLKKRIELIIKTTLGRCKTRYDLGNSDLDIGFFLECFWNSVEKKNILSREDIICGIASAWYACTGCGKEKPFVFKETSQAIHFLEIKKEIPSCKFINLIRDPRDNYAALKAGVEKYYSSMGEKELETLASLINRTRTDLLAAGLHTKEYPDQFYALKFEELTSDPEREMRKTARFVGIDFDECLLHPTSFGRLYNGNSHEGKKFSGISNENVGKWRKRISDFEAQVIEFWLGDVMEQWGYERIFPRDKCSVSFSRFYDWYNCKYFYSDRFASR